MGFTSIYIKDAKTSKVKCSPGASDYLIKTQFCETWCSSFQHKKTNKKKTVTQLQRLDEP